MDGPPRMELNMIEELSKVPFIPFNPAVKAWKEQGNKVIGFLCCYVPEEIIYAAGMLPYRIRATGCAKTNQGDVWMSNFSCSFARSCLEFALDGRYDFLDGLVASDSCGQAHRLYDNWRFKAGRSFMHFLTVPRKSSESAITWYREEMVNLKEGLEEFFGIAITRESLEKAIKTYNETRKLLRELYELRRSDPPPITGLQSQSLVLAAMSMGKDQYNHLLRRYLEKIMGSEPITNYRARLMIIGSALDDPTFIKIIEDQGGLVVTDAQCFGSRYLWEPVEIEGDIMSSLAKSYLNRATCPRMMDQHVVIFSFIKDMVQRFKVDGIIYQKMKFCDLWGGESLFLERKLKESKIPFLALQREHIITNKEQIATRVEAFIEMIREVTE
jgi:bzd-type benzoyl-CoA reductase N subunit